MKTITQVVEVIRQGRVVDITATDSFLTIAFLWANLGYCEAIIRVLSAMPPGKVHGCFQRAAEAALPAFKQMRDDLSPAEGLVQLMQFVAETHDIIITRPEKHP